jgi:hypothetical protein
VPEWQINDGGRHTLMVDFQCSHPSHCPYEHERFPFHDMTTLPYISMGELLSKARGLPVVASSQETSEILRGIKYTL